MIQFKKRQQGFSLVEMAIVLVILSVLIGGGFSTMGAYLDNAKQSHTLGSLENTKKAMLNYVKVNYYMPCPDTNNDGVEDRVSGLACTSSIGTVPFTSLGLGAAIASDDFGNVFAYGVDTGVTMVASMTDKDLSASYFSNTVNSNGDFPAFRLETPPTSTNTDVATSYTVCKKSATVCDATPSNVEVNSIPAIIVAFNENGGATALSGCNAETGNEAENCNNDLFVWKKFFSDGAYDDQLVTISGYEIKEQVLGLINEMNLTFNDSVYAGYDLIVRGDVSNSNVTNVSTQGDDAVYIDTAGLDANGNPIGGNLDIAGFGMGKGNDKLHVEKDVTSGASANLGEGNDYLYVGGVIYGSVDLNKGDDVSELVGGVGVGGKFDAGEGDDTVTVLGGVIEGVILMGNEADELILESVTIGSGAYIVGGAGNDLLRVDVLPSAFDPTTLSRVWEFETIIFKDNSVQDLTEANFPDLPAPADLPSNL